LIIDPAEPDPVVYDREYVVMLSDWTFEDPHRVLTNLKKMEGYYNYQKRTLAGLAREIAEGRGWSSFTNRLAWGGMRMDATDIADVTGATYTYLMNGLAPESNWTGLFAAGERVRLRFINGSAMSFFDVRIPGLAMSVVQADGQNIKPVEVDEFRIGVAETYDVIVRPEADRAYTVFAESMDRSGHARGTLAPRLGMQAAIPKRRPRPLRTMADMGMRDMHGEHEERGGHTSKSRTMPAGPMKHAADSVDHEKMDHAAMGHGTLDRGEMNPGSMSQPVGSADRAAPRKYDPHGPDRHGPGNSMIARLPTDRLSEPGVGLGDDGWRVLVYRDLEALAPFHDRREPTREIELHLTGNMQRYMWSFDGEKYSEVTQPIEFHEGERLRLILVNDTMMEHPIHLHGMWLELENGAGLLPRKHTLNVKPAERLSALISAEARGSWAFHCHLLYHMEMGMFRVVRIS
jgi:CopA family copper-resistance protein